MDKGHLLVEQKDRDLIARITTIRSLNNRRWMQLVELALEVAPERARAIFAQISNNDAAILKLSQELAQLPSSSTEPGP